MRKGYHRRLALLVLFILVIPSLLQVPSTGVEESPSLQIVEALPSSTSAPIQIPGLPIPLCGDAPCLAIDRNPSIPSGSEIGHEPFGWWHTASPDRDHNGLDDRLQRILAGEYESPSPTAVIGPDGRLTVALVLDWGWHPGQRELDLVLHVLSAHGWNRHGADLFLPPTLDSIVIDRVPVSAITDLWHIYGVVHVEQQNVMVPFNDVAAKAVRARPSEDYWATAHERGYRGDGVVIAVLDTGVDNEHRSLNDFDDVDDEPNLDPQSYSDPKWVAGYDATNPVSNPDGTVDPDDSNEPSGHGTHVAGTALGTGDDTRQHMGVAPGAYLVDVKVLTDAGGTNSASSIRGLTWVLNNSDSDWGNNASSRGIQVASMSFGSASNPNDDDVGDNGTSSEARLVNQIVASGVTCVIAMGNDGKNRVPSPASADLAITVGNVNERGTVDRSDDLMNPSSNFGPRLSDDDDNTYDELKPTVSAPGTAINSARFVGAGSVPNPLGDRPKADREYHELTGTSMATPVVSGVVALMLQADSDLEPNDIRSLMENHSESFDDAYDSTLHPVWNARWGFGMVDSTALLDAILGEDNGGGSPGGPGTDPNSTQGGPEWVIIEQPTNASWVVRGKAMEIRGSIDAPSGEVVDRIQVQIGNGEWINVAVGKTWSRTVNIDSEYPFGEHLYIRVRARSEGGEWSTTASRFVWVGAMKVFPDAPPADRALSGEQTLTANWEAIDPNRIEIKIDDGDWMVKGTMSIDESHSHSGTIYANGTWSYTFNTDTLPDGQHKVRFRVVNDSGLLSDEAAITVVIDNINAPDLRVRGDLAVETASGQTVGSAWVGERLQVSAEITNIGDATASDVLVRLEENGLICDAVIFTIESGANVVVKFHYTSENSTCASLAGDANLVVRIDPEKQIDDVDRSNNEAETTFKLLERPSGIDLLVHRTDVSTDPRIPRPSDPFYIQLYVSNEGADVSNSAIITIDRWGTVNGNGGWTTLVDKSLGSLLGGELSSQMILEIPPTSTIGVSLHRIRVDSTDEWANRTSNNVLEFNIISEDVAVSADIEAPDDLEPIELIRTDDGGLLFSRVGEQLHVRKMTATRTFISSPLVVEDRWSGDLAVSSTEGGTVYAAWTRIAESHHGSLVQYVSLAAIGPRGEVSSHIDLLGPRPILEGRWWGLDLEQHNGHWNLAGYDRDLASNGTWIARTSIWILDSSTPLVKSSWKMTPSVIADVDLLPSQGQSLALGVGAHHAHLLYQSRRDDGGGLSRLGTFYAHGNVGTVKAWAFDMDVGDHASQPNLEVVGSNEQSDLLALAWFEGADSSRQLVIRAMPDNASKDQTTVMRISTPSGTRVAIDQDAVGAVILSDTAQRFGHQIVWGRIFITANGSLDVWYGNEIADGRLISASSLADGTEVLYASDDGRLLVRGLVLDPISQSVPQNSQRGLSSLLPSLSLPVGITFAAIVVFCLTAVSLRRRKIRRIGENTAKVWSNDEMTANSISTSVGGEGEQKETKRERKQREREEIEAEAQKSEAAKLRQERRKSRVAKMEQDDNEH